MTRRKRLGIVLLAVPSLAVVFAIGHMIATSPQPLVAAAAFVTVAVLGGFLVAGIRLLSQ